jgi:hypothetical protein
MEAEIAKHEFLVNALKEYGLSNSEVSIKMCYLCGVKDFELRGNCDYIYYSRSSKKEGSYKPTDLYCGKCVTEKPELFKSIDRDNLTCELA